MAKESENTQLSPKEKKDLKVLALFTHVYCRAHHGGVKQGLSPQEIAGVPGLSRYGYCSECREFLIYSFERRLRCPLDPKPVCKHCTVHCYKPGHREKVREIMRFSGRHLMLRGRLDLLWHYFF